MPSEFRRKVLYIPGFDPFPPRRYRELYRSEGRRQAAISGYHLRLGPASLPDGQGWTSAAQFGTRRSAAEFRVLVWSDLVQASMRQGIAATYRQLLQVAWLYLRSGALFHLMRLRRGPVLAALYPIVMLLLQAVIALLAGMAVAALALRAMPWWLAGVPAAIVALAILAGFRRLDRYLYAYYLMHDYAFTAMERGAYPEALDRRLDDFAEQLDRALAEDPDEVLLVGHSSGAYLAVSVLARHLRRRKDNSSRAVLSLLTLGQVIPMASFLPGARDLRRDLALLSEHPDIFWLDVTAPGDACCFALCDPVAVTGVAGPKQRWPLVISAAFRKTLSSDSLRRLRGRWFRLHLQYLCAFDRPGAYDYFAITSGPLTLAQRFAGRRPSPGRIATPVGPGLT